MAVTANVSFCLRAEQTSRVLRASVLLYDKVGFLCFFFSSGYQHSIDLFIICVLSAIQIIETLLYVVYTFCVCMYVGSRAVQCKDCTYLS